MLNKKNKNSTKKIFHRNSSVQEKRVKPQKKETTLSFSGILIKIQNQYYVEVKDSQQQIKILPKNLGKAKIRDKVIVSKNKFFQNNIIGHTCEDSFLEVSKKFYEKNIFFKEDFSEEIIKNLKNLKEPQIQDYPQRKDLTQDHIITIDPHGARDHDDAISFKKIKSGWILNVHIADVSEYIIENSLLDKEAFQRSFTRYLPWKVVSMLPKKLSNNLCSLKENRQRLAFTCSIQLDTYGKLLDFSFFESIIQVKRFYTYEEAWKEYQKPNTYFKDLVSLANLIKSQRQHIIEFDFPETKIVLDSNGEPSLSKQIERLPSYQWIEDFMLICNQCCAQFMKQNHIQGLYRIHENPDRENVLSLANQPKIICNPKKWLKIVNSIHHKNKLNQDYRRIYANLLSSLDLNHSKGIQSNNIQRQILRTMKKAVYSEENLGHFALGFKNYAHFTSPIRRYPDLWNHRLMKQFLQTKKVSKKNTESIAHKAESISQIEIETTKLERDSNKVALAWILKDRIGDLFDATITEINEKGFAFIFQDSKVSGEEWIPIFCLTDDYYIFIEQTQVLKGKRLNKKFKLGQTIKVFLETTSPIDAMIRFRVH